MKKGWWIGLCIVLLIIDLFLVIRLKILQKSNFTGKLFLKNENTKGKQKWKRCADRMEKINAILKLIILALFKTILIPKVLKASLKIKKVKESSYPIYQKHLKTI